MLTPLDTNFLDGISVGVFLIILAIPAILWVITLVSIITSRNWTPSMKALWALAALPSGLIGMICWFVWGRPEGNKLAIEYYGGQLPTAVAPYGQQIPGTYATQPQQAQAPAAPAPAPAPAQPPADAAPYGTGAFGDGQAAPGAAKYATTQGQRFDAGTAYGATQGFAPGQDSAGQDSAGQDGAGQASAQDATGHSAAAQGAADQPTEPIVPTSQGGAAPQTDAAPRADEASDDGDTRPDIPQVPDNGSDASGKTTN